MKEYLEKELNRYVIATLDNPTNYLMAKGNCTYQFIDNIQMASKFVKYEDTQEVLDSCNIKYTFDMVIVPLKVRYVLIDEEGDE